MDEQTRSLYPDLIEHGGLANALQSALERIGSSMHVSDLGAAIRPASYAMLSSGDRQSQVSIASQIRKFHLDFWCRGVVLAEGWTPALETAACAIDWWVGSDRGAEELARAFDFIELTEDALVYERGEEVEHRWRTYLQTIPESIPELAAIVPAAAARPALRQLFPYTSMNRLCFSRCTGYPYSEDTPWIFPKGGDQYEVFARTGKSLGSAGTEQALDLVIANLPPGCGPAAAGTKDDLGY
jgi:hypothetical protein